MGYDRFEMSTGRAIPSTYLPSALHETELSMGCGDFKVLTFGFAQVCGSVSAMAHMTPDSSATATRLPVGSKAASSFQSLVNDRTCGVCTFHTRTVPSSLAVSMASFCALKMTR